MKSMFKKVLHVLLVLAIIHVCVFNAYAEDENPTCSCGATYSTNSIDYYYDVVFGRIDACCGDEIVTGYVCNQCGDTISITTECNVSSHTWQRSLEPLEDGSILKTITCTTCGYTETEIIEAMSVLQPDIIA